MKIMISKTYEIKIISIKQHRNSSINNRNILYFTCLKDIAEITDHIQPMEFKYVVTNGEIESSFQITTNSQIKQIANQRTYYIRLNDNENLLLDGVGNLKAYLIFKEKRSIYYSIIKSITNPF
ncbi:hypothetical protein [Pedobacter sp. D749]|uniref:hypothetical protein n=1 Tax=Pedobacter sp. D749 TaxID=2856523 RepID=UPI001C584581|nr:hypothetical protein [Pedobacter sp. D749]QXU43166.1 hypothetical protein KYH19_06150 [Pedobacter sp. D749]